MAPARCVMLFSVAALLALPGLCLAGEDVFHVRTHRATFWNESRSPRASGMGGSWAALSNNAAGVYENPAGLGAQTTREVLLDLGIDFLDRDDKYATVVTVHAGGACNINVCAPEYWPRDNVGNHTVGVVARHRGVDFDGADALATDIDGLVMAYGRSLRGGKAFVGAALGLDEGGQVDDDRTIDTDVLRFDFRLGAIYRATDSLAFGAVFGMSVGDVDGMGTAWNHSGDLGQLDLRLGAAYQLAPETLFVSDILHSTLETDYGDQVVEEHSMWRFSLGVEQVVMPKTFLARAGLYYFRDSYYGRGAPSSSVVDDFAGLTAGGSYFSKSLEISYNFDLRTTWEHAHFLRVGCEW